MPLSFRSASCFASIAVLLAGCGASSTDSAEESADFAVAATLQPQSFVQGKLGGKNQLVYAFTGSAGDYVSPDIFPAQAGSSLVPTLTLLGPRGASGHRAAIAQGTPRSSDASPSTASSCPRRGSYLVVAGSAAGSAGDFSTLRLWSSASHAPRPEAAQLDLSSHADPAMLASIHAHAGGGAQAATSWTDAQVDALISATLAEPDALVAFSDARELMVALADAAGNGLATADLCARQRGGRAAGRLAARLRLAVQLCPGLRALLVRRDAVRRLHARDRRSPRRQFDQRDEPHLGPRRLADCVVARRQRRPRQPRPGDAHRRRRLRLRRQLDLRPARQRRNRGLQLVLHRFVERERQPGWANDPPAPPSPKMTESSERWTQFLWRLNS